MKMSDYNYRIRYFTTAVSQNLNNLILQSYYVVQSFVSLCSNLLFEVLPI